MAVDHSDPPVVVIDPAAAGAQPGAPAAPETARVLFPWEGHRVETIALLGLLILGVLGVLYFAEAVFLPIFLALLLSIVLSAPVRHLRRIGVPDAIGAGIVVLAFIGLIAFGFYQLSAPAAEWIQRWPVLVDQIDVKIGALRDSLEAAQSVTAEIEEIATVTSAGDPQRVVLEGPSLAETMLNQAQLVIANVAVMLVLLYFMLAQGRHMMRRVLASFGDAERRAQAEAVALRINADIGLYLRTITLINFSLGAATAGALYLLGVPSPILWGALAAVLNFIPYVGGIGTAAMILVVSLLSFNAWSDILMPPLAFLALNTIEGQFVTPMVLGRRLTLNQIAVFISILFWGWLWGVVGALLAVPILAILKIVSDNVKGLAWARPLLG